MENGPFINDFLIETSIYKGFSMAMLNNQRVRVFYGLAVVESRQTSAALDSMAAAFALVGRVPRACSVLSF